MELANRRSWRIRGAGRQDAGEIGRLLGIAPLRHVHADWHLPADWLGTPGFVLCEQEQAADRTELLACLAAGVDPPPAAWVRVAAASRARGAEAWFDEMLRMIRPWLCDSGATVLGWLNDGAWPDPLLAGLGFQVANWIVTYQLDLSAPESLRRPTAAIRPATTADVGWLADIERAAFDPLWRHSQHGLLLAFREAIAFEVAEVDGRVVGFQYSVAGHDGASAHLVRLTVAPEAQGQGIGGSLLRSALLGYAKMGLQRVTLNTQADNHASHRLYERFGFRTLTGRVAVWAMTLE
jgi:ribosomal protein S18 acetylase RimI-like enzyme